MPLDPDAIDDAIEAAAAGPKRVQVGNESVEARDIDDLLKARNAAASEDAASITGGGIRIQRIIPKYY